MIQKAAQEQPIIFRKETCPTILNVSNAGDHAGLLNASLECAVNGVESR